MKAPEEVNDVLQKASEAMAFAHVPASGFHVGAAVRGSSGEIYSACNVEVKPSANTLHAEQRAIAKAIEGGESGLMVLALRTDGEDVKPPCGNCLQTICTFDDDLPIYVIDGRVPALDKKDGRMYEVERYSADELLPEPYTSRE